MRARAIYFNQCELGAIDGDQLHVSGSLILRRDTICRGELSLVGAKTSGDLVICGVTFEVGNGPAIFANGATIEGSTFIGDYPYESNELSLFSDAPLYFAATRIGGDFFIENASLTAGAGILSNNISLDGAEGENRVAFSLARASIGGLLFAKNLQVASGSFNFSGLSVRRLNDEPSGDNNGFPLRLDGFEYKEFAQHTDISVSSRLEWLNRRPAGIGFSAQPYEQLARVYEKLGHTSDAQFVLMKKEETQRLHDIDEMVENKSWFRLGLLCIGFVLLKWLVGFGYRPIRALMWALLFIACGWIFFKATWDAGDMAPNAAPILISRDWIAATEAHPKNPAQFWSQPGQAGQDYETFSALAYSADLFIPIINLGQETAWAPSTSRSPLGRIAWWVRWIAKTIGWVVTALGAAAITGVIRR